MKEITASTVDGVIPSVHVQIVPTWQLAQGVGPPVITITHFDEEEDMWHIHALRMSLIYEQHTHNCYSSRRSI
jgi:hypothetical protein